MNQITVKRDNKLDLKLTALSYFETRTKPFLEKIDYWFVNHEWPSEGL